MPDCAADRVKQHLRVHGLPQVRGGTGLLNATSGRGIVPGGRDKDDRDLHPVGGQTLLELEPAPIEMDVEHEAVRSTADQRVKKVAGGGKALDGIAVRLDQAMERSKDRGIVVDDGN